jgi:hypothetical protein
MNNGATNSSYQNGVFSYVTGNWSVTSGLIDIACEMGLCTTPSTRTVFRCKATKEQLRKFLARCQRELDAAA